MAVQTTEEFKNGGATSYAITIEYLKASDIKVRIGGALQTYVASNPSSGEYTVSGTTVTLGAQAAAGSGNVHIYRETDVNTAAAVFAAGSSIKAADLNAIHDMARFGLSEARSTTIESDIKDGAVTSAKIKDGTIVNADVNASAAIDGTKINPNFGSQNIVTSGTVDGRDVSVDGTKLDGIESGATANQTNAEIKTAYEANSNTNTYTDAEKTKLSGIESSATADQTNSEIKTAYEANSNTNAYTDAEKTKLSGIESSATSDQTGAEIKTAYEGEANTNAFTDAEKTKLSGVEASADVTDATNVNAAGAVMNSDLDGKGEILIGDGSGDPTALSVGTNNYVLTADSNEATGVKWAAAQGGGGGGGGVSNIVEDTSPQLGGNLDVQTREINTSTTNGNIKLNPNGTGVIEIKGSGTGGTLQLNCENNSHGIKLKSPPHSAAASYTLTFPNNVVNGQFLKTDASGNLSWAAVDLTALSASNLTSGTIPDARFPATLPAVSGANLTNLPASAFNILINTLSSSSGTGGGSATFNGTATRFTLSNPGPNAQAHIVSVNGVIQKPNSGTSPSEGYAIDGNDIIFASAPANGADFFIITIGKAVTIGAPSDNTVTTVKIVDDAVTTDKLANSINTEIAANTAKTSNATHTGEVTGGTALTIADNVVDEANLKVSNSPTNGYFLSAQSGNTGGLTWAEVSAGVTSDGQNNTVAGTNAGDSFDGTNANNNSLFGKDAGTAITTADQNVAFGANALAATTTSNNNAAVGYDALKANTTGTFNTALGSDCLETVTTSSHCTGVGSQVLKVNTAAGNTGVGSRAMEATTSGSNNTGVGFDALKANTTGASNSALGASSLDANTSGLANTAVGKDSLSANTTASYNSALGVEALRDNTTASSNTGIGFAALKVNTTGADNTGVGRNALTANTTGTYNTAVGTYAVQNNTTASYNTGVGYGALADNTTAANNTAVGYLAGGNLTTGKENVIIGSNAGYSTTDADENTFVGQHSGYSTTTGEKNTFIGRKAGQLNTTASNNTACGHKALESNTTGTLNVAVGSNALDANTTGGSNTAVGNNALGANTTAFNNTAVGTSAGQSITTGQRNVFIGANAGQNTTTSNGLTMVGKSAGTNNTTGHLIAIGQNAGHNHTTGDQNTVIGNNALYSCTTGINNIAIGSNALYSNTSATGNSTVIGRYANMLMTTGNQTTSIGANAGYGTTTGTYNINLGGSPSSATSNYQITLGNTGHNNLRCNDTSISSLSDRRDKTNIIDLPVGLDFLNTLKPRQFKWQTRDGNIKDGSTRCGFIAQELGDAQANYKYLQLVMDDNPNKLEANEGHLIPLLVKAIQELSAKVTALEAA